MRHLIPLTLAALLAAGPVAAQGTPVAPQPVVAGKGVISTRALAVVPLLLLLILGGSRGSASGSGTSSQ